ncbi:reverse transcriptase domain-containing protein [Tanacetum coccineum]
MPEDSRVPIILGRPFLATAQAMIDVFNKKITLRVEDDEVIFDVYQSIKRPTTKDGECYRIDDLDDTVNDEAQELQANEEPGSFLSRGLEKSIDQSDLDCYESASSDGNNRSKNSIRRINSANTPYPVMQGTTKRDDVKSEHLYSASANEIDEKKPELKNFPQHLEYAYLHGDKSFPIIISSELSEKEKFSLLQVLEKRKGAIAWKMSDIKGINNLDRMLARCEETNHVLNWEKCHFMVKEGIVLGHKISGVGIEVDRAKINVIAKLPYPTNVKGVRSFLGNAGFYRRFLKDFPMISKPITQLLIKDAKFDFFDDCKKAFNILKEKLSTAPIIISTVWNVPFELMCDASDFAVGAVLGHRIDGNFKPIYYASKTLNNAQEHYTTTKKEILTVVFSFDKFHQYLILSKSIVYTDHSALKYLFSKEDVKPRLIRLENPDLGTFTEEEITDEFPDEHLMILKAKLNNDEPWYVDYVNYIVGKIPCSNNVMRICVAGNEILEILAHCHSGPTEGHQSALITRRKVYESGFYWPSIFIDAKDYVMRCDACQRSGNISSRSEMPQNNIQTEVTNRAIKHILERSVGYNLKNWSEKLDNALWAFRTAYKTPTGCTPFRLVYEKACHLPVEIEHKAYWALKQCNIDRTAAAKNRFMELNELMELRDEAYENTRIYKEQTKRWHDSRI